MILPSRLGLSVVKFEVSFKAESLLLRVTFLVIILFLELIALLLKLLLRGNTIDRSSLDDLAMSCEETSLFELAVESIGTPFTGEFTNTTAITMLNIAAKTNEDELLMLSSCEICILQLI